MADQILPTGRELEALKVLWQKGDATVREVCDAISAGGEELAYTTVLSLLQVMEQKGFVGHRRIGKAYAYFAKVERQRTCRRLAGSFLDRVFDGALDEYLLHALQSRRMTAKELSLLEEMITEAKSHSRKQNKKGGRK